METKRLTRNNPILGCDPELFFEKGGEIVGAEKVLPKEGSLSYTTRNQDGTPDPYLATHKGVVLDGVQVEINPRPNRCRESLAEEMQKHLINLKNHLLTTEGVKASFKSVINLKQEELDSLSEQAKLLGCAPSLNTYDKAAGISASAMTSLTRSAGGHIHLGLDYPLMVPGVRERLVPLLDILLGNTCVLIDRDPEAGRRRETYGRAGEHRLPPHGLEYRTLSNFWLQNYVLFSFVMGMARVATSTLSTTLRGAKPYGTSTYGSQFPLTYWDAESALLSLVDLEKVRAAINENSLPLARENFAAIAPFLSSFCQSDVVWPLTTASLPYFLFFTERIEEEGMGFWFKEDPLLHWTTKPAFRSCGWESFIHGVVPVRMKMWEKEKGRLGVKVDKPTHLPHGHKDYVREMEEMKVRDATIYDHLTVSTAASTSDNNLPF